MIITVCMRSVTCIIFRYMLTMLDGLKKKKKKKKTNDDRYRKSIFLSCWPWASYRHCELTATILGACCHTWIPTYFAGGRKRTCGIRCSFCGRTWKVHKIAKKITGGCGRSWTRGTVKNSVSWRHRSRTRSSMQRWAWIIIENFS
jgi:hypothetical protein